jgi:alpha-tubulin suppressor-like RCC1 family protein
MTDRKTGYYSALDTDNFFDVFRYHTPDALYVKKEDISWLHPALDLGASTNELWATGCDYDPSFSFMTLGNIETNSSCYVFFNLDGSNNWKNLNTRPYNTWAVRKDGTLWGWGDGYWLGNNVTNIYYCTPTQVGALANWLCVDGYSNSVGALKTDNTLWTWGLNSEGQLGTSNTVDRASPVQVTGSWTKFAMGSVAALGVRSDGTLWSWGFGGGIMGNNSASSQSSPVQVCCFGNRGIKDIAVANRAAFAITEDGSLCSLWAWGYSCCGIRGDGATTGQKCTPVQICSGTKFKCIISSSCGASMHALDQYGNRYVWGMNRELTHGNGDSATNTCINVPTIADNFRWVALSKGYNTTMFGIAMDGSLWAWGRAKISGTNNSTSACYCCPVRVGTDKGWVTALAGSSAAVGLKEGKGGYL